MLKNHIIQLLQQNCQYQLTDSQETMIELMAEFISRRDAMEVFLLKGYAGTGKTSMIKTVVDTLAELKIKTVLLAPTGRAAKVLSYYTKKNAYTIHKKIYRQKSSAQGFGDFALDRNLHKNTFFIIDEASMISNRSGESSIFGSGHILDDLIEYVYSESSCKMILIGDTAQLPPVGLDISPALNKSVLEGFFLSVSEVCLTEVIRQAAGSGIFHNATNIRNLISADTPETIQPEFSLRNFDDIERIYGEDLIETISDSYNQSGIEETIVVCRSNKRANRYNQGIRNQILWREEELSTGDLVMVVKNNYFWIEKHENIDFIANGDIAEIQRIKKFHERYGYRYADVTLRFIDYENVEVDAKILLDTLNIETASLPNDKLKELFFQIDQDYSDIESKRKRYQKIKNDPFFNALQVKFAYAVTCHKAQGGQWDNVFVDQGYFTKERLNIEYLRWLYTAVTRATEKLYLVNFSDEFFAESKEV